MLRLLLAPLHQSLGDLLHAAFGRDAKTAIELLSGPALSFRTRIELAYLLGLLEFPMRAALLGLAEVEAASACEKWAGLAHPQVTAKLVALEQLSSDLNPPHGLPRERLACQSLLLADQLRLWVQALGPTLRCGFLAGRG